MPTRANSPVRTCRLGRAEYGEVAQLQRSLRAAREADATGDILLLVEHDPVITCGTRTEPHEVAFARTTSVPVVAVERGGKATYHGPGQVVAYPIFGIGLVEGDVKQLVWRLEESIIEALAAQGLITARRDGFPGVWVDPEGERPRKVASLGLRVTRGVTFHGIAVNVACDLEPFSWFTPCGIADADMTSLVRELDIDINDEARVAGLFRAVEHDVTQGIAARFGLEIEVTDPAQLRELARDFPTPQPDVALPGETRPGRSTRIPIGAPA